MISSRLFAHSHILICDKSLNLEKRFIWSCLSHTHANRPHLKLHLNCRPQTLRFPPSVVREREFLSYRLQVGCITQGTEICSGV